LTIPLLGGILKEGVLPLSGMEVRRLYELAGWIFEYQKGSHMILKKNGLHVSIPNHKELDKGMEHKLLKGLRGSK
jgi:predicted RNA binding protein YcfA (HicA-like mRNA interferase family)